MTSQDIVVSVPAPTPTNTTTKSIETVIQSSSGSADLRLGTVVLTEPPAAAGSAGGYIAAPVIRAFLAQLEQQCAYAALLAMDPRVSEDPSSSELSFPLYARQPVTWIAPSPGLLTLNAPLTWSNLAVGSRVAAVGFFPTATAGDLQAAVYLPDSLGVLASASFSVAAGDLYLGLDLY